MPKPNRKAIAMRLKAIGNPRKIIPNKAGNISPAAGMANMPVILSLRSLPASTGIFGSRGPSGGRRLTRDDLYGVANDFGDRLQRAPRGQR